MVSNSTFYTARKVSKYGVFSGPYFPEFELNTERYSVSLHTQSVCGKIQTRKNSVFEHFSGSVREVKEFKRSYNENKETIGVQVSFMRNRNNFPGFKKRICDRIFQVVTKIVKSSM